MLKEQISKLSHKQKIYRYAIPVQSFRQLITAIVYIAIFSVVYYLMTKLFVQQFGAADMSMKGAFFLGLVMVYFTLYTLLPTCFTISVYAGEKIHLMELLGRELRAMGYESMNIDGTDEAHYRKKGGGRLHWKEDDFYIALQGEKIIVKGPLFINDKLRHLLLKNSFA